MVPNHKNITNDFYRIRGVFRNPVKRLRWSFVSFVVMFFRLDRKIWCCEMFCILRNLHSNLVAKEVKNLIQLFFLWKNFMWVWKWEINSILQVCLQLVNLFSEKWSSKTTEIRLVSCDVKTVKYDWKCFIRF